MSINEVLGGVESKLQRLLFDSLYRDQLRGNPSNNLTNIIVSVLEKVDLAAVPAENHNRVQAALGRLILENALDLPTALGNNSRNTVGDKDFSESKYIDEKTPEFRAALIKIHNEVANEALESNLEKIVLLTEARKQLLWIEAIRWIRVTSQRNETNAYKFLRKSLGVSLSHKLIRDVWKRCFEKGGTKFANPDTYFLRIHKRMRRMNDRQKRPPKGSYSQEFLDTDSLIWLLIKQGKIRLAKKISIESLSKQSNSTKY